MKFGPSGEMLWSLLIGAPQTEVLGRKIAVGADGSCWVTGITNGSIGDQNITGLRDAFIARIDPAGEQQWVRLLGAADSATYGNSIAVDPSGCCYVAGTTSGALDKHPMGGYTDAFTVKFGPAGARQWIRQLGAAGADTGGTGVAVDSEGNVCVAGATSGALDGEDFTELMGAFAVRYTRSGAQKWIRVMGAGEYTVTEGLGIALDAAGSAYLMGRTDGSLDGESPAGMTYVFVSTELN